MDESHFDYIAGIMRLLRPTSMSYGNYALMVAYFSGIFARDFPGFNKKRFEDYCFFRR